MRAKHVVIALAVCFGIRIPLLGSTAGDLAMLFETLGRMSQAAEVIEGLKAKNGKVPKATTPLDLSQARFGHEGLVDMMMDPWGTPFHIDSDPARGYLIVAAGSDRKFDRTTWGKAAATRSTADDIVMRNGRWIRSPVEWASAAAVKAAGDPVEQLERALYLSRHTRTVADLRMIALAIGAYQADHGKFPDVKTIDELATNLAPGYIGRLPRTDAWNRPLRVAVNPARTSYYVASAGPDGEFNVRSWVNAALASDDVVLHDGRISRNEKPSSAGTVNDPELEKARATMKMFEELKDALRRYESENFRIPEAKSVDELQRALVPKYATSVPRADAWGTPLRIERDGSTLLIVAAGADHKFNRARWKEGVVTGDYERDLVLRGSSVESVWDVSDPADRLARAYAGFWTSQK